MKLLYRNSVVLISLILFCIPFFWFASGEMDLGGDSSRLYFYNPIKFLQNYALSGISPSNVGAEHIGYYSIPFVSFLSLLQKNNISSTLMIEMFHGLTLSLSFLFMYFVVKELLSYFNSSKNSYVSVVSIVSGLLYIFSPISIFGWDKVLITHYKFFLNPLMFFLLLRFFSSNKFIYIVIALLVSFVFSANFSFASAPPFIAFYGLSIVYLLLYTKFILQKPIYWKRIVLAVFLFIFIQSFHLLPHLISLVTPESQLFNTVFLDSGKYDRGLNYFNGILEAIKVSQNILLLPQFSKSQLLYYLFFFLPLVVIYAGVKFANKSILERKFFALTCGIFLVALFFVSANITSTGIFIYRSLFAIPGFSMFRNFYGQWVGVYLFYFVLMFGVSVFGIIHLFSKKVILITIPTFIIFLIFNALPLITGASVNPLLWQSKELRIVTTLDPAYEQALYAVSNLPKDGKVLTLPLTDPGYQIVAGTNSGAYQGPSMIAYVSGKQDFSGYEEFGVYKSLLVQYMNEEDYESLKKLFGLLNIRYIFWNSDTHVYDDFLNFPYVSVRRFMPKNQKSYGDLLNILGVQEIASFGQTYKLYQLPERYVKPELYISQKVKRIERASDDISLPLTLLSTSDNGSAIVLKDTQSVIDQSVESGTQEVDIIKPYSVFARMKKNTEPPTYLHHAFAKYSPRSFLYSLVLAKEQLALSRMQDSTISGIDYRLFLSAKRVYELEKYVKDLFLTNDVGSLEELRLKYKKPPSLRNINSLWSSMFESFDSWEILLSWYESLMREAIELTHTYSLESDDYRYQEYIISAYLSQHQERMDSLIKNAFTNRGDREYMQRVSDEMFTSLHQMLSGRFLNMFSVSYDLSHTTQNGRLKTVKVKASDMGALKISDIYLDDGQTKYLFILSEDGQWYETNIGNIKNIKEIRLVYNASTSVLHQKKIEIDEKKMTDKQNTLEVRSDFISGNHGLLWEVTPWIPKQHYYLSFQYKTQGKGYDVKIVEKNIKKINNSDELLSREYIKSVDWSMYQVVVLSHTNTDSGYLQLAPTVSDDAISRIELKNFSLIAVPVPELIVEDTKENTMEVQIAPAMTYQKISPSKYLVHVTNAFNPYYIVLNQQFNSRWRINIEPNKNVSRLKHMVANTYANAWLITPQDVGGKTEYSFVVEFGMQKYFYIGMVLSIATVVLLLCFLIYRTILKAYKV